MKNTLLRYPILPCILLLGLVFGCGQQKEKADVEMKSGDNLRFKEIPAAVMDALMARFPGAEIQKWTREKEGDIVLYDIEFKQQGWKFEADIRENGAIHNWEKAVETKDLPEAVRQAVEMKYPKSTTKEIMQVTSVKDGKDALEAYEIVLETSDRKEAEVTAAPDGKILEDSGQKE